MKVIGNLTKDAIIRAAVSEGLSVTQAVGTDVIFNSGSTTGFAAAFDSSTGKVVIAFSDSTDGHKGKAVVGTVNPSNNSISFGSEVVFQNSSITGDQMDCVFDSNANKVVIFYTDTNNPGTDDRTGTAIVGTVSGTSISFGTKAAFESGNTQEINACFDSTNNKFVVTYRDADNSNYATSAVGTVSGTGISFGTPVVFNSAGTTAAIAVDFDANAGKVVVAYQDSGDGAKGKAIVGTVSGTSISFGSEVTFDSGVVGHTEVVYDASAQKTVIAYLDAINSDRGTALVGTVSGTSFSFGSGVVFNSGQTQYIRGVYDAEAQKIALVYKDGGNSNRPTFISGAVSGTSITFDTETVLKDVEGVTILPGVAYDSTNKRVVAAYLDSTGSDNGLAQVISVGYSSATGGTIADGKPVIVNANGTVSSVGNETVSTSIPTTSSPVDFDAESANYMLKLLKNRNKNIFVVAYMDGGNSNYGTAVVGTISGNSITFSSATVFESASVYNISISFDASNPSNFVIAYADQGNSTRGTAIVGTISGTSLSFGSAATFTTGTAADSIDVDFLVSNKFVVAYQDGGNSNYGTAKIGTVSGTSLSFGSASVFESAATIGVKVKKDPNATDIYVVAYLDNGNSNYGTSIVGTASGTSISYGSAVVFKSASANNYGLAFDPNTANKLVISFESSSTFKAVIGTRSGTSLSFGSEATIKSNGINYSSVSYDPNTANQFVIAYRDKGNSNYGTATVCTVSSSTITVGTSYVYSAYLTNYNVFIINTDGKLAVSFNNQAGGSGVGSTILGQLAGEVPNITTENFVGFMDGAALDGTNGEILSSCSIARNQTSLTAGQTYFVLPTGALSLTAGSPSVTAGTAISSKELIAKG